MNLLHVSIYVVCAIGAGCSFATLFVRMKRGMPIDYSVFIHLTIFAAVVVLTAAGN